MKKFSLFGAIALLALGVISCDARPKVLGAWQGEVTKNMPGDVRSMIATYTFEKNGDATASYLWNIAQPLQQSDSIVAAYEVSVSGTAAMSGTWQYAHGENDEVVITIDPASLQVNVDPEGVEYRENMLTGTQAPALEHLKPAIASKYGEMIRQDFTANGMILRLDDIEIKGQAMKFEQDGTDYLFKKL